jgi:hypothetical protein
MERRGRITCLGIRPRPRGVACTESLSRIAAA